MISFSFMAYFMFLIYRGGFGKVKLAESDTVTGRGTVKCQYAIKISNK